MKSKIRFGNSTIQYSIVKSKRRKTSQIVVDKDNVIVRTPTTKTFPEIRKIMKAKAKWIFRKQLEFKKIKPAISKITYSNGSKLPYLGRHHSLKIITNQNSNSAKLNKRHFVITLSQKKSSKKLVKHLYENWLMRQSEKMFPGKVKRFSRKLGANPSKLVIKNLKNRWGSTTKSGVINLNLNLLKAPEDVIDYVILHELCHLKIKVHNHHFWEYVRKYIPNYEEKKLWLDQHGQRIV